MKEYKTLTAEEKKKIEKEEYRKHINQGITSNKQESENQKPILKQEKELPWWKPKGKGAWLLVIFFVTYLVFALITPDSTNKNDSNSSLKTDNQNTQPKKEIDKTLLASEVTEKLVSNLDNFNQEVGFQFFKGVQLQDVGVYWAVFTVSDDWYSLEPHLKERLVTIATSYYKEVEGGLNSLAEISFEDQFGKELAWGSWSSSDIKVKMK